MVDSQVCSTKEASWDEQLEGCLLEKHHVPQLIGTYFMVWALSSLCLVRSKEVLMFGVKGYGMFPLLGFNIYEPKECGEKLFQ